MSCLFESIYLYTRTINPNSSPTPPSIYLSLFTDILTITVNTIASFLWTRPVSSVSVPASAAVSTSASISSNTSSLMVSVNNGTVEIDLIAVWLLVEAGLAVVRLPREYLLYRSQQSPNQLPTTANTQQQQQTTLTHRLLSIYKTITYHLSLSNWVIGFTFLILLGIQRMSLSSTVLSDESNNISINTNTTTSQQGQQEQQYLSASTILAIIEIMLGPTIWILLIVLATVNVFRIKYGLEPIGGITGSGGDNGGYRLGYVDDDDEVDGDGEMDLTVRFRQTIYEGVYHVGRGQTVDAHGEFLTSHRGLTPSELAQTKIYIFKPSTTTSKQIKPTTTFPKAQKKDQHEISTTNQEISHGTIATLPTSPSEQVPEQVSEQEPLITDPCFICLSTFTSNEKIRILPCNHKFHQQCIDPWLLGPLCKEEPISNTDEGEEVDGDNNVLPHDQTQIQQDGVEVMLPARDEIGNDDQGKSSAINTNIDTITSNTRGQQRQREQELETSVEDDHEAGGQGEEEESPRIMYRLNLGHRECPVCKQDVMKMLCLAGGGGNM
ncbi:hypothetical protein HDU76_000126, partial [Blyttiomyces sp. JEL0837]